MAKAHAFRLSVTSPLLWLCGVSLSQSAIVIDTFDAEQETEVITSLYNTSIHDAQIFGGARNTMAFVDRPDGGGSITLSFTGGAMNFVKSGVIYSPESGAAFIWNGTGDPIVDVDITEAGLSDQLQLSIGSYSGSGIVGLQLIDTSGNSSVGFFNFSGTSSTGGILALNFSDLTTEEAGAQLADLTHITSITLAIKHEDPSDFSISINDLRIIPEPASASLVVLSAVCLAGRRRRM